MVRELIDKTWEPWTGRLERKNPDGEAYARDRHLVVKESHLVKPTESHLVKPTSVRGGGLWRGGR